MAYKNYKIRDNWLDIDKYNDVDIQSVDGVISSVKVNGEDYGGGGGSGLTTANVTIVNNTGDTTSFDGCLIINDKLNSGVGLSVGTNILSVVLYEGYAYCGTYDVDMSTAVITGNATYSSEDDCYIITGDCTITIS